MSRVRLNRLERSAIILRDGEACVYCHADLSRGPPDWVVMVRAGPVVVTSCLSCRHRRRELSQGTIERIARIDLEPYRQLARMFRGREPPRAREPTDPERDLIELVLSGL
jgi:hypothetical protein